MDGTLERLLYVKSAEGARPSGSNSQAKGQGHNFSTTLILLESFFVIFPLFLEPNQL